MILFFMFIVIIIFTFARYMETDKNIYLLLFLATIWTMIYIYWTAINNIVEENKYLYETKINF